MGYYSYFSISRHDGKDLPVDLKDQLEIISGYAFDQISPDTIEASESIKWYEHDAHMPKISEMYPGILFQVYRNGEESDDEVMYYYLDGQSESTCVVKTFASPTLVPLGPKFGTIKSLT